MKQEPHSGKELQHKSTDDIFYSFEDEEDDAFPERGDAEADNGEPKGEPEEVKPSRSPWKLFLKVLMNPVEGWKELKRSKVTAAQFGWKFFYPILLIAALSYIAMPVYGIEFSAARIVSDIVITFMSLLLSNFIAALCCEWFGGKGMRKQMRTDFGRNFIMTIIGSAAIVVILWQWLPMMSPIISFLPLYSIYLIVRGVKYLRIPTNRTNAMIMMFAALCIGLPLLLYTLFSALLPE